MTYKKGTTTKQGRIPPPLARSTRQMWPNRTTALAALESLKIYRNDENIRTAITQAIAKRDEPAPHGAWSAPLKDRLSLLFLTQYPSASGIRSQRRIRLLHQHRDAAP